MYANIYQISDSILSQEKWIKSDDFYKSNFVGTVADKVEDESNPEESIRTLNEHLNKLYLGTVEDNAIIISASIDRSPYFVKKYKSFRKTANALSRLYYSDYLCNIDKVKDMISEMQQQFCEVLDDYVCFDSEYLMPMDEFLRTAIAGKRYFINGICKFKY